MKTVNDLIAKVEEGLQIGPDGVCRHSETGEEFKEIRVVGPASVGPEPLFECMLSALLGLRGDPAGKTIYWRKRPELTPSRRGARLELRCRVLISAKPRDPNFAIKGIE